MTNSEKFDRLIEAVLNEMNNHDFPFGLRFEIPGTKNAAIMDIVPDELDKTGYCFRIAAHRNGYDMLVSYFWKTAYKDEMKEYIKTALKEESEREKIRKAIEELSDTVDEKMD